MYRSPYFENLWKLQKSLVLEDLGVCLWSGLIFKMKNVFQISYFNHHFSLTMNNVSSVLIKLHVS